MKLSMYEPLFDVQPSITLFGAKTVHDTGINPQWMFLLQNGILFHHRRSTHDLKVQSMPPNLG